MYPSPRGPIAISHNGNLVNGALLREELERSGSIFQSTTDTEVIVHLIATSKGGTLMSRIVEALSRVRGAYSLLFLTLDKMIAARDPYGFRPLVLGKFPEGKNRGAFVFPSRFDACQCLTHSTRSTGRDTRAGFAERQ